MFGCTALETGRIASAVDHVPALPETMSGLGIAGTVATGLLMVLGALVLAFAAKLLNGRGRGGRSDGTGSSS